MMVPTEPLRILLVESSEAERQACRQALQADHSQHRISECADAQTAQARLEQNPENFDVIVADHDLPDQTGLALSWLLLAQPRPLPIILLSRGGCEQRAVQAMKLGISDYVVKDAEAGFLATLPGILHDAVRRHREQQTRRGATEALQHSERWLSQIVQRIAIPAFVIDRNHQVIYWNRACERLTGFTAERVVGTRDQWRAFYDSRRPVMADLMVDQVLDEVIARHYPGVYRSSQLIEGAYEAEGFFPALGESGKWLFFTAAPLHDENGQIIGALETLQDITQTKRAEEALRESEQQFREMSITDGLTGLYNSRHFFERLAEETERARRYQLPLSFMIMDVDNFKHFNDTYGHPAGNEVLTRLGHLIKTGIRASDTAYRYGGEEFVVLLPQTDARGAHTLAQRLCQQFSQERFALGTGYTQVTMSIGVTQYQPGETPEAFIQRGDENLYQAKHLGKNRVQGNPDAATTYSSFDPAC